MEYEKGTSHEDIRCINDIEYDIQRFISDDHSRVVVEGLGYPDGYINASLIKVSNLYATHKYTCPSELYSVCV